MIMKFYGVRRLAEGRGGWALRRAILETFIFNDLVNDQIDILINELIDE